MPGLSADDFKQSLQQQHQKEAGNDNGGIVLDIDETLSATNVKWFERCIDLFGNHPDDVDDGGNPSVSDLIDKYHLAQNNPAWQTKEASDWMHAQRTAPEAQDDLPVIPGAVDGVQELLLKMKNIVPIVGYLTVRPESVTENTIRWLKENGFPDHLPVVAKPDDVPFEDGNKWKGAVLNDLWPEVIGIVDDNPKVPTFAGPDYKGTVYLFGRDRTEPQYEWAIPCKTWPDVVQAIRQRTPKTAARKNGVK